MKDGTSKSFAREPVLLNQGHCESKELIPRESDKVKGIHERKGSTDLGMLFTASFGLDVKRETVSAGERTAAGATVDQDTLGLERTGARLTRRDLDHVWRRSKI